MSVRLLQTAGSVRGLSIDFERDRFADHSQIEDVPFARWFGETGTFRTGQVADVPFLPLQQVDLMRRFGSGLPIGGGSDVDARVVLDRLQRLPFDVQFEVTVRVMTAQPTVSRLEPEAAINDIGFAIVFDGPTEERDTVEERLRVANRLLGRDAARTERHRQTNDDGEQTTSDGASHGQHAAASRASGLEGGHYSNGERKRKPGRQGRVFSMRWLRSHACPPAASTRATNSHRPPDPRKLNRPPLRAGALRSSPFSSTVAGASRLCAS